MDVFVEPVVPQPEHWIFGASPVAIALADLAARLDFRVCASASGAELSKFAGLADATAADFNLAALPPADRYIVVATQGRGDEAALTAALADPPPCFVAFVGSRKKASALRDKLAQRGIAGERLAAVRSPAGLDIAAVTPEEIAVSILGEIIASRRRGQRSEPPSTL